MAHETAHQLAGQNVIVQLKSRTNGEPIDPVPATLEDWWDRVYGKSWMYSEGNPAALNYAYRSGTNGLPINDEVVYVKINGMGELVHESELLPA